MQQSPDPSSASQKKIILALVKFNDFYGLRASMPCVCGFHFSCPTLQTQAALTRRAHVQWLRCQNLTPE